MSPRQALLRTGPLTWLVVLSGSASASRQAEPSMTLQSSCLDVVLRADSGSLSVTDRRAGYTWQTQSRMWVRRARRTAGGLSFEADLGPSGRPRWAEVAVSLAPLPADLTIDLTLPPDDRLGTAPGPIDLAPSRPGMSLAVADYCDGHLYPLDLKPFPRGWLAGDRLDLPFVGMCGPSDGPGCCTILATADDLAVELRPTSIAGTQAHVPRYLWQPTKGRFGYPRRLVYRFTPKGGYVAVAKAYRRYARDTGLLVTLCDKARKNPRVRRLYGAPDVWGDASLDFAREAKAAGVERMLIHGRPTPAEIRAVNALGYLTSEYDNYTDILPARTASEIDSSHDELPSAAVQTPDGARMKAWLTYDKQTQYMKRCPARWSDVAERVVGKLLGTFPYLGRFIDVTTAEGLYECFDPAHPLTKADKRRCGEALLRTIRRHGLVVGGEHGIWWGVPYQDYIEGMMSSYQFAWPAGHLMRPKTRSDQFTGPYGTDTWESYERWGLGHTFRIPLWQLVFHDCIVSTWYWGDSNDFLLDAAPELTAKKDAFNILYGTPPMMWGSPEGSWRRSRDTFMRTYRNTCKLHEQIADKEMLSHEFLTVDGALQRTRFSDGTVCVVNFGGTAQRVTLGSRAFLLPQYGFAVRGPKVQQYLAAQGATQVTAIEAPGYRYVSRGDNSLTVSHLGLGRSAVTVRGLAVARIDDRSPATRRAAARVYRLSAAGDRLAYVPSTRQPSGLLEWRAERSGATYEVLQGAAAAKPDLAVLALAGPRRTAPPSDTVTLEAHVANVGGRDVRGASIAMYADYTSPERLLAQRLMTVRSAGRVHIRIPVRTAGLDGYRRLIATVRTPKPAIELCELNNRAEAAIQVIPNLRNWTRSRSMTVALPSDWPANATVSASVDLPNVDPASVRVVADPHPTALTELVPSQYDHGSPGLLTFRPQTASHSARSTHYRVIWAERSASHPSAASQWRAPGAARDGVSWSPEDRAVFAGAYSVRFNNGHLVDLRPRIASVLGQPMASMLIVSSAQTGWVSEPGTVNRFAVQRRGPLVLSVLVDKSLAAGIRYLKTYDFHPDRIDVATTINSDATVHNRLYLLQSCRYEDSGGCRAKVDGAGDGEGVLGVTRRPTWFALFSPEWAFSCIARTPVNDITYWDSAAWGGIGFMGGVGRKSRQTFVFHGGRQDASFAAIDLAQIQTPPAITLR